MEKGDIQQADTNSSQQKYRGSDNYDDEIFSDTFTFIDRN